MRGILVLVLVFGCRAKNAPSDPKPSDPPPDPAVSMVTSFVMVEACPESKKIDTRQATREIDELVGPCKKVPTGAAHFSATLLPNGRVELASPSGDPTEGMVPTCLVQNAGQLKHKLHLSKSCKFDVKLEQRGQGR